MSTQADTIILNGKLLTMDPDKPRAEAIALAGGRILAVGTTAEIEALAGPDTRRIDAAGGSVLPGFSENHMHLFSGAAELDHLQLSGLRGFEALKAAVLDYAAARPGDSMIFGQGTDYPILGEKERLTRHHLDAILADRPIALFAPDHHTGWANTKALELSGILHGRDVGPGNEIVMGEDGLATGSCGRCRPSIPCRSPAASAATGWVLPPAASRTPIRPRRSSPSTWMSCAAG